MYYTYDYNFIIEKGQKPELKEDVQGVKSGIGRFSDAELLCPSGCSMLLTWICGNIYNDVNLEARCSMSIQSIYRGFLTGCNQEGAPNRDL